MTEAARFGDVAVTVDGAVARLVLDRPERRNSLTEVMLRGLIDAADWLGDRPKVKVVTLRGAGDQFTAGADVELLAWLHSAVATADDADLGRVMADAVAGIRAVTVACVTGYAIGGGVVLAASCDLRVFAADAWFSIPEIDIGIPFGWGGIPRLVRLVGLGTATDLILTGRRVKADEAQRLGFADRVVPLESLDGEVDELVAVLAAKPGGPLWADLRALRDVGEALVSARDRRSDADMMLHVMGDDEARRAGRQYLERFGS